MSGQAHVPLPKLEALLCQACGLGIGAGRKGLICVFWGATELAVQPPPTVPCLLEKWGSVSLPCLPLKSWAQKKSLL